MEQMGYGKKDAESGHTDMEYGQIPGFSKQVPRLFFGTAWKLFLDGGDANALLDEVVSQGFHAIDTARQYGRAEESVGNWLQTREDRENLVILTKCAHPNILGMARVKPSVLRKELEQSLEALKTSYIDIWLLHRDDPKVEVGPIIETMNEALSAGKVRIFGVSNWMTNRIEEANEYAYAHNLQPFSVSSPYFGLADQAMAPWKGCISIAGPSGESEREWYRKNKMPIISYSGLAGGFLSGKYKANDRDAMAAGLDPVAFRTYVFDENCRRLSKCEELAEKKGCTVSEIALAFVLCSRMDTYAIVGSSSPERMKGNLRALSVKLSEEEMRYLEE